MYADATLVDGAVNGTGTGLLKLGEFLRRFQSGQVRNYAALILIAVAGLIAVVVLGVL